MNLVSWIETFIFIRGVIVVDTGYAGIHHSKYWMPIHYDTIEDGQNKKSHLLFSKTSNLGECELELACIHHSKYWMPIHYDTIEDGQNKKSYLFILILS